MGNINEKFGERVIRAEYDMETITIYQAFSKKIALPAVAAQTFISPPFKMERMTWIKPSFLWMMYRSGWALKEEGKQILKIKITHQGFEEALRMSCLSTYHKEIYHTKEKWRNKLAISPVRIQWDPERDLFLQPLNYRTIQIGLSDIAVKKYLNQWIVSIENITEYTREIHLLTETNIKKAKILLPKEKYYPIALDIYQTIGIKKTANSF